MKSEFTIYKFTILIFVFFFGGCGNHYVSNLPVSSNQFAPQNANTFPLLPTPQKVEDEIVVYKVRLNQEDEASDVWIYMPEKPTSEKLPAVLITAAGSYLWNGTSLDEGDQPEHLPYVKKGYIVIAYETPGDLKKVDLSKIESNRLLKAINDFKNSKAGLVQEQNALNYALDKVSLIDSERIFIAGHSSAATHSLLVAANDTRIKAAIAYAPATDLEKRLADEIVSWNPYVPGFKEFIKQSSPSNNVSKIKIPVFIFQAVNDSVIPIEDTKRFVDDFKKFNPNVTFITTNSGDHYDSMIQKGIPKGIEWLDKFAFSSKSKLTNSQ